MRYTQSQIRGLVSISVDEFKTWRKIVPALVAHKGHGPTFTPGDVVAMAIVAELVRDFGLRVGKVAVQLDEIFQVCHGRSWHSLESCMVLVDAGSIRLVDVNALLRAPPEGTTIIVPCSPIVARLQSALTRTEVEASQGYLHLPPTAISSPRERRGKTA